MPLQEDIHVLVKFPELQKANTESDDKSLNLGPLPAETSLLKLKERCKAYLAEQVTAEAWNEISKLNRHFWLDGQFLPEYTGKEAENRLEYAVQKRFIVLIFCRDTYVIHTPGETREWVIDPEMSVSEMLETLHAKGKITSVCCYDVFNAHGTPLNLEKSLYAQGTLPYWDPKHRDASHLSVRLKAENRRTAVGVLILLAVLGFAAGFLLRRFGY